MPRVRIWLVIVPLVFAGTQVGTTILDTFAPQSYEGSELFSPSNASHVFLAPLFALGGLLVLGALLSLARSARAGQFVPRWVFACVPLLVFALQEHVEYAVGHERVPWGLVAHPIFVVGLLLQAPLAIAAYLVARLLLAVASVLAGSRPNTTTRPRLRRSPRPASEAPRRTRLAGACRSTRGPPLPISA